MKHTMGTSKRDVFVDRRKTELPGPGSYQAYPEAAPLGWVAVPSPQSISAGIQSRGKSRAPVHSLGQKRTVVIGEPRPQTTQQAGPGAYTIRGTLEHKSHRSKQIEHKHTMGTSSREIFRGESQNPNPGPGSYEVGRIETGFGKQVQSTHDNSFTGAFCDRTSRHPINYRLVG